MRIHGKHILFFSACLAACILAICCACGEGGKAAEPRGERESSGDVSVYYSAYGDRADKTLDERLNELEADHPGAAAKWRSIAELWKSSNHDLQLHYDVLPDGLPRTDELCIVVLGFQLNPDGSMRDELMGRLMVAKASAEKYPNALVACTGGPTASSDRDATEAGKMAEWLIANGIAAERVIVEDKSLTTAQNAMFTLAILSEKYPQVTKLAIVSSDYHIASGILLFGAESTLQAEKAGEEKYAVLSNAAWKAPSGSLSAAFQAGALAELSGDRETAWRIYYDEFDTHD